jgi:site-specific recombinase XerC
MRCIFGKKCSALCRARHNRHTFCSHLAMRGAAPRAIQELAGHAHFATTQRYMHLSPAALDRAIDLLESKIAGTCGDIGETGQY